MEIAKNLFRRQLASGSPRTRTGPDRGRGRVPGDEQGFEVDTAKEKHLLTFNLTGYLRSVK